MIATGWAYTRRGGGCFITKKGAKQRGRLGSCILSPPLPISPPPSPWTEIKSVFEEWRGYPPWAISLNSLLNKSVCWGGCSFPSPLILLSVKLSINYSEYIISIYYSDIRTLFTTFSLRKKKEKKKNTTISSFKAPKYKHAYKRYLWRDGGRCSLAEGVVGQNSWDSHVFSLCQKNSYTITTPTQPYYNLLVAAVITPTPPSPPFPPSLRQHLHTDLSLSLNLHSSVN